MRRVAPFLGTAFAALLLFGGPAQAAPPAVGSLGATNIQGVSALLKGAVNPEGLPTTYRFEYAPVPGGALTTAAVSAGHGSTPFPARATISGLAPNTTYRYRLIATNSSGSNSAEASFQTTQGFGPLPGEEGFAARVLDEGSAAALAGTHPERLDLSLALRQGGELEGRPGVSVSDGDLRDVEFTLPQGLLPNPDPKVIGRCSPTAFATPRFSGFEDSASGESCPTNGQVGTVEVETSSGAARRFGLFNLAPAPGSFAQFGFSPYGAPIVFDLAIPQAADGSYTLSLRARNIPQRLNLSSLSLSLWGTPWAASHDGERGNCLNETDPAFPWAKCSVGPAASTTPLAFLSLPARCDSPLSFGLTISSWQQPGTTFAQAQSHDPGKAAAPLRGCDQLQVTNFAAFGFLTDKKASSPSGYNFQLTNDVGPLTRPLERINPPARRAVVTLPPGVTINPSVGAGLEGCGPAQYAAETPYSPLGAGCPNGSKIGDFFAHAPFLGGSEKIEGAIYLAAPDDLRTQAPGAENPFDELVAVYLIAKLPERGVQIKLAGRIRPDPASGDIVATFDGLPQFPYTDLNVNFRTGQRSFLITPPACGPAVTTIEASSWGTGLPIVTRSSESSIDSGIEGGPCPSGGALSFAPRVLSGAYNSSVGYYTPYFIHLTRSDTEQEITSYSLVLPKGITGKLAGIPVCPEAAIAAARRSSGFAEAANPSCPQASLVGHVDSGYGIGVALTYASGSVYLAGPYHGAPLSLVTVNSATVGPFDLGTIVIRSAFQVDPLTAQLQIDSSASDPIPHIIRGIPLHLRDVRVYIDRPEFARNPTGCEASQLTSTLTGSGSRFGDPSDDSRATATSYFQLLNCLTLGFRPKLGIRLRGGSKRGDYPQLRTTFAARGRGDANLKRIEVSMPHSEFLAQEHIKGICTRGRFAAERCPPDSIYGKAVAYTPLFDEPLRGNVYLRSSSNPLPDLVASLRSGAIRIILEGAISPSKKGGIRALFQGLPDAPITRFVMTLNGGKRGLLVNSANICAQPPLATVRALGQNNIGASFTTLLRGQCNAAKKRRNK